mmetsp:Transcript_2003/g.5431  ORF Transcript_2003/g.5431 Transcript_2003/m.5431 type:complete len:222 (+) Transcript_2003:862-1527(+)
MPGVRSTGRSMGTASSSSESRASTPTASSSGPTAESGRGWPRPRHRRAQPPREPPRRPPTAGAKRTLPPTLLKPRTAMPATMHRSGLAGVTSRGTRTGTRRTTSCLARTRKRSRWTRSGSSRAKTTGRASTLASTTASLATSPGPSRRTSLSSRRSRHFTPSLRSSSPQNWWRTSGSASTRDQHRCRSSLSLQPCRVGTSCAARRPAAGRPRPSSYPSSRA